MKKNILKIILVPIFPILLSCAPKADIFVQDSGDLVLTLNIIPSKTTEQILEKFMEFSDDGKSNSVFNTEEMKESLKKENIDVLEMKTQSLAGISTKVKLKKENRTAAEFFVFDGSEGKLACKITPANIKEFAGMLSSEDREYFDLLMAPVLTGESMNAAEYEALISSAYGETIAKDLKKSKFVMTFRFPKKITAASIKPFGKIETSGVNAVSEIKLTDLLTVKEEISIEIKYGK